MVIENKIMNEIILFLLIWLKSNKEYIVAINRGTTIAALLPAKMIFIERYIIGINKSNVKIKFILFFKLI